MKRTSSSEIYNTICHNGKYLLLFRKRILKGFEISCE